jgi:two-component system chemotaxis response regulator CheB
LDEERMATRDVIVIGASAGGFEAVVELVRGLPSPLPAAVFVVVHCPDDHQSALPGLLSRATPLPASLAVDGEPVEEGRIYVGGTGSHLVLDPGRVRLAAGPRENGRRPSIDVLFRSASRAYGPRVVCVVLTGVLDDGASGAAAVKRRGGLVVVQSPEDAAFSQMPEAAIEAVGAADHSAPLRDLATLLVMLSHTSAPEPGLFPVPADVAVEDEIARGRPADCRVAGLLGTPSAFGCPECGGVLSELNATALSRYRCSVGHAWSAMHLFHAQRSSLQQTLWSAVEILREQAELARLLDRETKPVASGDASRLLARALRSDSLSSRLIAMLQPAATKREDASVAARPSLSQPAGEPSRDQPV